MAIVKILARHSPTYKSLISYILNEAKIDRAQVYTQNLRSDNVDGHVQEFILNESFRARMRSDSVFMTHEIWSINKRELTEHITPAMLDDLAYKYMELRGNTGVMIGAIHQDTAHIHCHFAVSALNYRTGTSFGLNKAQLHELKTNFQEYHRTKYPELSKSFPEHGKGGCALHPAQWHILKRADIIAQVRACFLLASSQQDFLARLRDMGLHHYERNGKVTGIEYDGQKFRFTRLLEGQQFADLPVERSEEEQTLEAIRTLRARQQELDERDHDIEDRER